MAAHPRAAWWLTTAVALLLATGCASVTPKAEIMTALGVPPAHRYEHTLAVEVEGGGELPHRIHSDSFEQALVASLVDAEVFSNVVQPDRGDYRLQVILGDLKQPAAGANFSVEMTTLWTLWRGSESLPLWQSLVVSQDTRGVSDAFNAQNRLRLATEMAARANISEGIRLLSAAEIESAVEPDDATGAETAAGGFE